ncbi:receptor-like protein 7 [Lolium rigidum]|uniref:receptor-like protein 7 n=1 Tax=Lolium rigidum TaxID=89674 RepID=UPI001F5CBF37|nr:receptor-like protein 7 [Lolium rigidum]
MAPSNQQALHVLLLLLVLSYSVDTAAKHNTTVSCLPDQASSILRLKDSFIDIDSKLASWQAGRDCCQWEGVTCGMASGTVISLDLGGFNLQSSRLDSALFNLTSLRNLNFASNDFRSAHLPSYGFERLIDMVHLNFSATNFFGQIPIGIARLKNLVSLDFSHNNGMYLQEPNFLILIANLSNLKELHFDEVDISRSG